MNLVLDDAEEVYVEKAGKEAKPRQDLGKSYLPPSKLRFTPSVFPQTHPMMAHGVFHIWTGM